MTRRNRTTTFRPSVKTLLCGILSLFFSIELFAQPQDIHALRSAYLYYFSYFISWPDETHFKDSTLLLCALTNSKNDRFQLGTIDNKPLGNNRLKIHFIEPTETPKNNILSACHILYISEDYNAISYSKLDLTKRKTLVITEGKPAERGEIHLFTENSKLKFEINNAELSKYQFKVSSKLMRLSRKENP